jgi:hypothetical protein
LCLFTPGHFPFQQFETETTNSVNGPFFLNLRMCRDIPEYIPQHQILYIPSLHPSPQACKRDSSLKGLKRIWVWGFLAPIRIQKQGICEATSEAWPAEPSRSLAYGAVGRRPEFQLLGRDEINAFTSLLGDREGCLIRDSAFLACSFGLFIGEQ